MVVYERTSHYYETDQMGIIHHANYLHWLEEARLFFMEQMGYGYARTEEEGILIPVIGVSCEYKHMVRFPQTLLIETWISAFNGVRMTVEYKICGQEGTLHATAQSKHCFLDRAGRPVSLKKALPALYEHFMSQVAK